MAQAVETARREAGMTARIIDGVAEAARLRESIRAEAAALLDRHARAPGLRVIIVGDNPASRAYVRTKTRMAAEAGIDGALIELPEEATTGQLLATIDRLNRDPAVHGILVQLPLPGHMDAQAVLGALAPEKDVDGFHPLNVGRLFSAGGQLPPDLLVPCTPYGCLHLLRGALGSAGLAGKEAAIVGRSNIVGKPMAALLLRENCTVSICHSRTRDLPAITRQADILVAAVGRPAFLGADHVREGAVVIDVGINRIQDPLEVERLFPGDEARRQQLAARGSTIVGDVDFTRVAPIASAITPVPGGVGPLTVAMVLANTLNAARRRQGLSTFHFGAART
jgi:methylenetetrahydrofolate dehydrogenase (NADP+)/methenyltetrahydrofolate cyclohydrolase